MAAANFEIFSTDSEGDTRRTLQFFEQISGFFSDALGVRIDTTDPIRVILFGSKKEYEPYKMNEFAIAYYMGGAGKDYIVMGSADDNAFPVAAHEYTHLVVRHAGWNLPPWLNEGIAELYSTLKPYGGKIMVGQVIPGRLQALNREKWVPLETILAADHNSPYYNEKAKAGNLYNEGWALTHMLALSTAYNPGFSKAVNAIRGGMGSAKALEQVYGKPVSAIEKDLQGYIRGDVVRVSLLPGKLQTNLEKTVAEPANLYDVRLALIDLTNRPGKEAETRSKLEELRDEQPKRPEAYAGLGYVAVRERKYEDALDLFAKAIDLGSESKEVLWDYGRMAGMKDTTGATKALQRLMAAQPSRQEVRLQLANVQLVARKPKDALETLAPVRSVTPEEAARFFRLMAYANAGVENFDQAKSAAQRWSENAKEELDKTQSTQFLDYLANRERAAQLNAQRQAQASAAGGTAGLNSMSDAMPNAPGLPGAQRDDREKIEYLGPNAPPVVVKPSVSGTFVEFDCKTAKAPLFVLMTDKGRLTFLMDDDSKLQAFGLPEARGLELTCGLQTPRNLRIQYDPPGMGQAGITGLARGLYFNEEAKPAGTPTGGSVTPTDPAKAKQLKQR